MIPQSRKSRLVAAGGVTALGVFLVGYTGFWESGSKVYHYPYQDVGGVWTVCQGHTGRDVVPGEYYSTADCNALEAKDLQIAEQRFAGCVANPDAIPDPSYAAFVDWTYNVGQQCRSTLVRKLNAGDLKGACAELPKWVYVGSKVYQGLVNRRYKGVPGQVSEYTLCMQGVK